MSLKLVKLSKENKELFDEMMNEWSKESGESLTPSAIFKNDYHDFDNYLKNLEIREDTSSLVSDSVYFLLDENLNKFIGATDIRHHLNDYLLNFGGHIGDGIRPSFRGKGYGTELVKLSLEIAKKLGIDRVLMTCLKSNIPSKNTIIRNGGIKENEVIKDNEIIERYWIDNR